MGAKKKRSPIPATSQIWLPGQDSNLERQDQNLLCYHYTTGNQSFISKC